MPLVTLRGSFPIGNGNAVAKLIYSPFCCFCVGDNMSEQPLLILTSLIELQTSISRDESIVIFQLLQNYH